MKYPAKAAGEQNDHRHLPPADRPRFKRKQKGHNWSLRLLAPNKKNVYTFFFFIHLSTPRAPICLIGLRRSAWFCFLLHSPMSLLSLRVSPPSHVGFLLTRFAKMFRTARWVRLERGRPFAPLSPLTASPFRLVKVFGECACATQSFHFDKVKMQDHGYYNAMCRPDLAGVCACARRYSFNDLWQLGQLRRRILCADL